jgi:hypothetical protein
VTRTGKNAINVREAVFTGYYSITAKGWGKNLTPQPPLRYSEGEQTQAGMFVIEPSFTCNSPDRIITHN